MWDAVKIMEKSDDRKEGQKYPSPMRSEHYPDFEGNDNYSLGAIKLIPFWDPVLCWRYSNMGLDRWGNVSLYFGPHYPHPYGLLSIIFFILDIVVHFLGIVLCLKNSNSLIAWWIYFRYEATVFFFHYICHCYLHCDLLINALDQCCQRRKVDSRR